MKKFYSTLGMMLTVGVAFAAGPNYMPTSNVISNVDELKSEFLPVSNQTNLKKVAKAPASMEDVYGNYMWIGVSGLQNAQIDGFAQGDMILRKGNSANQVIVEGVNFLSDAPIVADVDLQAGTISFPNRQLVGETRDGNVYFIHYRWNATGNGIDEIDAPLVGYFDKDGGINFDSEDCMALWIPDLGGYFLEYVNMLTKRPTELPNEGWQDAGTATITNNWMNCIPVDGLNKEPYHVKYQTSVEDPNLIRLVDPYGKGTPFEGINESIAQGAIYINLEAPECVNVFRAYEAVVGTNASGEEMTAIIGNYAGFMAMDQAYYPGNFSGYYYYEEGFTVEDIISEIPAEELSTYKDNVITIVDGVFGASFAVPSLYNGFEGSNVGVVKISLESAGVNDINVDDVNAPKEFYNLQGVKIANPKAGEIVIMRQGSSVKKIVAE